MRYKIEDMQFVIENGKVMWSNSWSELFHLEKVGYFTHKTYPDCANHTDYFPTKLFYDSAEIDKLSNR